METEYLDEEQVISLYNKVRTGKKTWPTGIWSSPAALQYAVTVFDYWIHTVMGWKGWPDARGKVTPALLEEHRLADLVESVFVPEFGEDWLDFEVVLNESMRLSEDDSWAPDLSDRQERVEAAFEHAEGPRCIRFIAGTRERKVLAATQILWRQDEIEVAVAAGERVLLTGPSGSGKSTLFRAIAGTWPFGAGTIRVPKGAKLMALPQRPYFPIGTLAAAVAYPAEPGTFDAEALSEVITAVGLPALAGRITEEAHWNRMLSLGEQQRLGIARAILQAPDYLFLDEATASLDEAAEAALYRLLNARLKRTTIVSIGHRSTLAAFHRRGLVLERDGELSRLREAALERAAE